MPHDPYALPDFTSWPTFPFEGDLRVKGLEDPVEPEPARQGEDPEECSACQAPDAAYIWVSQRWRVRALDRPSGLPMVLILESRSHLDLGDLPNLLAAELGVMTVRLERAIRSIEGVARVHINRWGDGSAHLHLWFLARPYGRLQLRGTFLSLWDDILPPIEEPRWRENLALVAAWLAEFGGRPLAEPPPMDWKTPTRFDERVESTVEGPVEVGVPTGPGPPPEVAWDREDVVHVPAFDPRSSVATTDPAEDPVAADGPAAAVVSGEPGDGTAGEAPAATETPGTTGEPSAADAPADAESPTTADGPSAGAGPHTGQRIQGTSGTGTDATEPGDASPPGTPKEGHAIRRRPKAGMSSQRSARSGRRPLVPDPADPEEAWEEGV